MFGWGKNRTINLNVSVEIPDDITGVGWNYEEEIEILKRTPLYADGRYDRAVNEHIDHPEYDVVYIAKKYFEPEYSTLVFLKKAELLTNIDHCQVDTVLHIHENKTEVLVRKT